ncbi:MAG: L-seryl-tRNA(Sec) selenium transferase [Ignavibacteria bacterium]|nr:L-seryl-tRNA(Sec) selenium transferase [Ignavibacteria bacterium]
MSPVQKQLLQHLPKVDKLLEDPRVSALLQQHPRSLVLDEVRAYLDELRVAIVDARLAEVPEQEAFVDGLVGRIDVALAPGLRRGINGVGIVLHTALGRAPFAESAQRALQEAAKNYCTLQVDLETGKRGDRYKNVERLLRRITGAEAAIVVNNNAAATLLILNTLAQGREVIVSRGELVEIGGSFRLPDVMKRSGAKLVEVGTTNRTHPKDYRNAITPETGAIMKVHQSNYRIVGFTSQVPIAELAQLAHQHSIPAVDDLGSGALVDLSRWGLPGEPMVQESIAAGADVVCFSGDKLLGGPQCGIILGRREIVERIKANQLTRALRCDKMTFAVLEATLKLFLDEKKLLAEHPVLRLLTMPEDEIRSRCVRLQERLSQVLAAAGSVTVVGDTSEVGSGSLAAVTLPTWVVAVTMKEKGPEHVARALRLARTPVFGRIKEQQFLLDCRTIRDDEIDLVVAGFEEMLSRQ